MAEIEFFDEILSVLQSEAKKDKSTYVSPEVMQEFYAEANKKSTTETKNSVTDNSQAMIDLNSSTIEETQQIASTCQRCKLHSSRRNVVFGEGNTNSDLMFIGEVPDDEEDRTGSPFTGKAGDLLTKMIAAMQFNRQDIYLTNIIKCHTPNNRNPEDDEANCCLTYLTQQIEIIKPKIIILMGAAPIWFLLRKKGVSKLHGQWDEFNGIKVMPTFHPSYLLRNPAAKREAWNDLQLVMQEFGKFHSTASN